MPNFRPATLLASVTCACFAVASASASVVHAQATDSADILVRGGTVVDGTGSPGRAADVAIRGDRIVFVGNATAAHIHGPSGTDTVGPVLIPLTVTPDMNGTVTGSASMNPTDMNAMLDSQTYVDIHTMYFDQGEIRAQIVQLQ